MTENRREKGVVLILTFIVMTTFTAIVVAFLSMISIQTKVGGYDIASHKALWLAEAGIQQVIYQLKNDANYRANPTTVNGSLGNGSYSVTVSVNGTTYTLTSIGTVSVLNRKITQSVVVAEAPEAFNYAQHTEKEIDFEDSSGTVTGKVHSEEEVINYGGMNMSGATITEGQGIAFPSVNYSSYESIADYIQNNDFTFTPGTYSGIYYCKKKVTIQGNVTINGSIISEKEVEFEGNNITITPSSNYPAVLAKKEIKIEEINNTNITGLVYSEKEIEIKETSNFTIQGSIISNKEIKVEENSSVTIIYNSNIQSNPPPYFSGGGSISVAPQKDWNEIVPAL